MKALLHFAIHSPRSFSLLGWVSLIACLVALSLSNAPWGGYALLTLVTLVHWVDGIAFGVRTTTAAALQTIKEVIRD